MSEKIVTIKSFSSAVEANLVKGKLESSGIPAFVFKDDLGGMRPHLQLTSGVNLKVRRKDAKRALKILEQSVSPKVQSSKHLRLESIVAISSLLAWALWAAGCVFILTGYTSGKVYYYIGTSLIIIGIICEIYSRRKKRNLR